MSESLYLVDAHSLIFQVFHAIPAMSGPKGQPTNAVFGFTGDLLRLRRRNPTYLVCVFDPPGKTFRDGLYEAYKAQRAPMPDDLSQQIPVIFRVLEAMRLPIVQVSGYEADDAIATIARQAEAKGIDVFICTGDKDIRQLISDRVKVYNVRKDATLDRAGLLADWGITPEQVVDLLALAGDSVDNVPGIPGVGIKTAQRLLQEHGTIAGVLAQVDQIKSARIRDNLKSHVTDLELGRKLIRLAVDVPLECDWDAWRVQPWDGAALLAVFRDCGFQKYANEVREEQIVLKRDREGAGAAHAPLPYGRGSEQGELFASASTREARYQLIDTPAKLADFLHAVKQQKRISMDMQTTLSQASPDSGEGRVGTDIAAFAFCWRAGEAYYLPLRGFEGQETLDAAATLDALKSILESPNVEKIGHDIKPDVLTLRRAGVRLAGLAGDPMLASYLLTAGERNHNLEELASRYLGYEAQTASAAERADLTWRLSEVLEGKVREQGLDRLYRELELPLVDVLADLEYNGVRVDVPLLKRLSVDFAAQLSTLEHDIHALAGHAFNIASPKQLRQVLFDELKLPAVRKTDVSREASTGQDVLEELAAVGHPLPQRIIEYRQIAKLKGTYVDTLPALVNPQTGRVHATFNQAATATGRLSSSDPNLQNIPVRTEQGRQIRQAFIPGEPGWLLLAADYSQIELRVLAHYSQDEELQRAFQEERDIHAHVAAQIYGITAAQVNREQRRAAKTVNFGVIYGLSAFGLAKRLGLSKEEAGDFIDRYFAQYPGVRQFQEQLLVDARQCGYVTTIMGRRRAIEGIRSRSSHRQRNQPEREALNAVLQGSAADLIKQAMINIARRLRQECSAARMLLQIHDELVFEVPKEELEATAALVAEEMTTALDLRVPLRVDLAVGRNWLDTEPIESGKIMSA